jgi:hypothetical protein
MSEVESPTQEVAESATEPVVEKTAEERSAVEQNA